MTDAGVDKVMDRLRTLENLVKELSSQLEQAHAAASSANGDSSEVNSPGSSSLAEHQGQPLSGMEDSSMNNQFGRLVLQDASRSRYVASGFWSRVDDELHGLKMDTCGLEGDESDSSEDDASPGPTSFTQEIARTPSGRHAFLFQHNLSPSGPDLRDFQPLPSQVPFILDVFSENVNFFYHIVHMPSITKMVRDLRGSGTTHLTPSNKALMFSIYYAAIISMDEDDIMTNFGSSKSDLSLKYRLGLEHALAQADFLNSPDIVLVQALAIFLFLARRHDSPRFVYMMTGLAIRMAQYLGLQRDGDNFKHLTPFEIDMRRRVWWAVVVLDLRSAEDQGTDMTIPNGSFDTKMPLNINDVDIDPESEQMPAERHGLTDRSFTRTFIEINNIMRQMTATAVLGNTSAASLEDQSRLLNDIYERFEQEYLQYSPESGNIAYWVAVTIVRLVMAKMTLIVFLPVLFSSPSEHVSEEIRTKLLIAAIEVAEYNHMLNAEEAARQWRWIYQVYTHWHAIVYLLMETCRRPWSPIIERAWVALHSTWLIPAQPPDKNLRIWVPLRKLMTQAGKHRDAEVTRLRADPQAAERLEMEDRNFPVPSSSGPFPDGSSNDTFRGRWRQLVEIAEGTTISGGTDTGRPGPALDAPYTSRAMETSVPVFDSGEVRSDATFEQTLFDMNEQQAAQTIPDSAIKTGAFSGTPGQTTSPAYRSTSTFPTDWSDSQTMVTGFVPWLWADSNPPAADFDANMDMDSEVNWYTWIESLKGMESGSGHQGCEKWFQH
ncbi:uncharacterized protein Z518_07422 [Rhinocladiella mackenziei CBS 650.93]|uniref:Rhinocladiella mackenziei CBS 650.93 unplaced genomic scaffold supercont1.5, whole genome shotgun sequence n=1 Tax=Rhinocladiella mackenziei CBS 650.93 TaxID=1442369 RepID=A0A0D2IDG7_9EURO|nr:uncharacterized protein Z518_07422 [Rhinocladiella mackenziei CBS 650.93]KIX03869.1 hypothetical protein Z518_07422 [Rhinocladiella mackenziei CBS 650.93]